MILNNGKYGTTRKKKRSIFYVKLKMGVYTTFEKLCNQFIWVVTFLLWVVMLHFTPWFFIKELIKLFFP